MMVKDPVETIRRWPHICVVKDIVHRINLTSVRQVGLNLLQALILEEIRF